MSETPKPTSPEPALPPRKPGEKVYDEAGHELAQSKGGVPIAGWLMPALVALGGTFLLSNAGGMLGTLGTVGMMATGFMAFMGVMKPESGVGEASVGIFRSLQGKAHEVMPDLIPEPTRAYTKEQLEAKAAGAGSAPAAGTPGADTTPGTSPVVDGAAERLDALKNLLGSSAAPLADKGVKEGASSTPPGYTGVDPRTLTPPATKGR